MLCYKKNDNLILAEIKPYSVRSKDKLDRILDKYFPIKEISNNNSIDEQLFKKYMSRYYSKNQIWNIEKSTDMSYLEDYLYNLMDITGSYDNVNFMPSEKSFKNGNFAINDFDTRVLGYNFDYGKMALLSDTDYGLYRLSQYKMLYPEITQFLAQAYKDNRILETSEKLFNLGSFDMTTLLDGGLDSLKDLRKILTEYDKKEVLNILYKYFPLFAEFYYNVCPSIKVNPLNTYSLEQLKGLKNEVAYLQLDTFTFDILIEQEEVAENNTKVLQLINRLK